MQNESNFHPHTHIEYFNPDVTSLAKAYQDSSSALSHFHAGKYYDSFDDFIKKRLFNIKTLVMASPMWSGMFFMMIPVRKKKEKLLPTIHFPQPPSPTKTGYVLTQMKLRSTTKSLIYRSVAFQQ